MFRFAQILVTRIVCVNFAYNMGKGKSGTKI